jgi:hypothetical protein
MNRKSRERLNVAKVLSEFRKAEKSSAHRQGTFKIKAPFEEALNTILKARPEPKLPNRRMKRKERAS